MLISNKIHYFRNFGVQINKKGPGFFSLEVHRDRIKSEHKVVSQLYIEIVFVS